MKANNFKHQISKIILTMLYQKNLFWSRKMLLKLLKATLTDSYFKAKVFHCKIQVKIVVMLFKRHKQKCGLRI